MENGIPLWRENNQAAGTTTVWDYDHAGNIAKRSVYDYTTGDVGALIEEVNYVYNDSQWGDLLKAYNGKPITYDAIGNPTNDFTWRYTWQHGRQLASMIRIGQPETWNFTYNADGLRTQKTNGTRTYQYTYLGDQLSQMTVDGHTLYFTYDTNGSPISLTYDGTNYYYVTNLQGDILALLDTTGTEVVRYTYDAWGNILTTTGTLASSVGYYNPLRYRGYVYDEETRLCYLQSRYYNPDMGRFINGDAFVSTGQGLYGNNMFEYCANNPLTKIDPTGHRHAIFADVCGGFGPNAQVLMAFHGVNKPSEIPEPPKNAMIYVENTTSVSMKSGCTVIEGKAVVFDENKYCEYTYVGIGFSISKSIPLDRTISQGYVYGITDVEDYCGFFFGASGNMLTGAFGGAYSNPEVYAEITGGTGFAPSIGGSITYYVTGQTDWIYGPANISIVTSPYNNSPLDINPYL